jgi:hypothetical protein
VKGEDKKNDLYDNLIDLIRIGQLSKSSIDSNFYNGVVGVHVVGKMICILIILFTQLTEYVNIGLQVTVYFTTLVAPGLYIMAEICSLAMPRDISCMRGYLSVCEDLLPLHNLYKTACCVVDDIESFKEKIRAGMNTPTFKNLIKTSKNRKRYCPFILNS